MKFIILNLGMLGSLEARRLGRLEKKEVKKVRG